MLRSLASGKCPKFPPMAENRFSQRYGWGGIGSKISFGVVLRPLMAEKSVSE